MSDCCQLQCSWNLHCTLQAWCTKGMSVSRILIWTRENIVFTAHDHTCSYKSPPLILPWTCLLSLVLKTSRLHTTSQALSKLISSCDRGVCSCKMQFSIVEPTSQFHEHRYTQAGVLNSSLRIRFRTEHLSYELTK
jgi:hypothetical protein